MKTPATFVLAAVLAFGAPASLAQHADGAVEVKPVDATAAAQRTDQLLYKGVVGNLLEAVPMDPEKRVELQRGNALLSAPFSARSLALILGITNPLVLIGGLARGIWAASRIEAPAQLARSEEGAAPQRMQVAGDDGAAD